MKKSIFLLVVILFASCGASKTVRTSKKSIKGNWTIIAINYETKGTLKVNLFNDTSSKCFEGSSWQFIPNNHSGVYTINKTNCNMGKRHFIFTIDEVNEATGLYDFLLKPTNEKGKSETNKGFRLRLTQLSETSMQWQQSVIVNGKPFNISINFSK